MKTIELRDGFGLNHLCLSEQPKPNPTENEVLVRLEAASLNAVDLLVIKGLLNPNLQLPYVPVADGAGVVEQVGAGVTAFQVGDRVTSTFVPNWIAGQPTPETVDNATRPGLGGVPGQLTEYKCFQVHQLIKAPVNLTLVEAATLPVAGLTAWNALRYGHLQAGQIVLLHGTGGVSIFALQFAKAQGAKVIITSSQDEKLARARQLGADYTINYKTTPHWKATVQEMTNGEGTDLILETVGGDHLKQSIAALRMGGHISIMGLLNGFEIGLDAIVLLNRQATIRGMEVGSRSDFEAMNQTILASDIHPVIDETFPLGQVQAAFKALEAGQHFGKLAVLF